MAKFRNLFDSAAVVETFGGGLADRFMIPPFSVLDARQGAWQERKAAWLSLGIKSEVGRGENLLKFSDTILEPDQNKRKAKAAAFNDLKSGEVCGPGALSKRFAERAKNKARATTFGSGGPSQLKRDLDGKKAHRAIPGGGTGPNSAWKFKGDSGYKTQNEIKHTQSANLKSGLTFNISTGVCASRGEETTAANTGTSIFDPVLCELFYRWFVPKKGLILDPFAGGSVRGIVANRLGYAYLGTDLRQEQVDANYAQAKTLADKKHPLNWVCSDARDIRKAAKGQKADAIFSCPPYVDLERYSDDPRDLSTMKWADFRPEYEGIIEETVSLLKEDRFAGFVVGEVRGKDGNLVGFVPGTIRAFRKAGMKLYNDAILVTAVGSLPMRAGKQFATTRKLGRTHQYLLIFAKGDTRKAADAIGAK
jgi:hypothetical protein